MIGGSGIELKGDTLLEHPGVGIRILVGVKDVASVFGEEAGDGRDDAGTIGT